MQNASADKRYSLEGGEGKEGRGSGRLQLGVTF